MCINMYVYFLHFYKFEVTNAKRLCEARLILFVCVISLPCVGALGPLASVQPVHHRHQIESQMSADVLLTIFTASPSREQLFLFSR